MLNKNSFICKKFILISLVLVMAVGCGGGRATTSSDNATIETSKVNPPAVLGSAELSWLPPTDYTDNTPLTELAGHNVYINDGSGFKKLVTINNPSVTAYVVESLSPGHYTFVVTAFDSLGIESAYSDEASIKI